MTEILLLPECVKSFFREKFAIAIFVYVSNVSKERSSLSAIWDKLLRDSWDACLIMTFEDNLVEKKTIISTIIKLMTSIAPQIFLEMERSLTN